MWLQAETAATSTFTSCAICMQRSVGWDISPIPDNQSINIAMFCPLEICVFNSTKAPQSVDSNLERLVFLQ